MKNLKEFIQQVKKDCEEVFAKKDMPDSNQILNSATFLFNYQDKGPKIQTAYDASRPSEKQIIILKKFYTGNIEILTRQEASALINEYFLNKEKDKLDSMNMEKRAVNDRKEWADSKESDLL